MNWTWYGWNIKFSRLPALSTLDSKKAVFDKEERVITVELIDDTEEGKYEAANRAIQIIVGIPELSLDAIISTPFGEPVVLYQESNKVQPGRPEIEFDKNRKFYIVRMASARYALDMNDKKLGSADYRMNPTIYAKSFSILIYQKQLPVPLIDKKLEFPGTHYDEIDKGLNLQNSFQPGRRNAINISRTTLLKRGRINGTWIRLMRAYGFWEMVDVEFILNNKAINETNADYLRDTFT